MKMLTKQINPSSSRTRKTVGKVPNLLRYYEDQEQQACPACYGDADPNDYPGRHITCTCEKGVMPFEDQAITNRFGRNDVKVFIPHFLLQGMDADSACETIGEKLNEHFDSDDVIEVKPTDNELTIIGFDIAPSYADFKFPCDMAMYRNTLRSDIEKQIGIILTDLQLTASMEVYA